MAQFFSNSYPLLSFFLNLMKVTEEDVPSNYLQQGVDIIYLNVCLAIELSISGTLSPWWLR